MNFKSLRNTHVKKLPMQSLLSCCYLWAEYQLLHHKLTVLNFCSSWVVVVICGGQIINPSTNLLIFCFSWVVVTFPLCWAVVICGRNINLPKHLFSALSVGRQLLLAVVIRGKTVNLFHALTQHASIFKSNMHFTWNFALASWLHFILFREINLNLSRLTERFYSAVISTLWIPSAWISFVNFSPLNAVYSIPCLWFWKRTVRHASMACLEIRGNIYLFPSSCRKMPNRRDYKRRPVCEISSYITEVIK